MDVTSCNWIALLLMVSNTCQVLAKVPENQRILNTQEEQSGCDETIASGNGTIRSPNYPKRYPDFTDCTWSLGSEGLQTTIFFDDFEVEDHYNCDFDYVEVRESQAGGFSTKLCGVGGLGRGFTFMGRLTIAMRSDQSLSLKGFSAQYSIGNTVHTFKCPAH